MRVPRHSRQISLSMGYLRGGSGEGYSEEELGAFVCFLLSTFLSPQVPGGSQHPPPGSPRHPQPVCQLQCPTAGHQEAAHRGKCPLASVSGPFLSEALLSDPSHVSRSSLQHPCLAHPGEAPGARQGPRGGSDGRGRSGSWAPQQGSSQPCLTPACPRSPPGTGVSLET